MNCTLANIIQWDDLIGAESYDWQLLNGAAGTVLASGNVTASEVSCLEVFDEQVNGSFNFQVRGVRGEFEGAWSDLLPLSFLLFGAPTGLTVV